jgi:tetratricopeptide (TPR) repeat protein
MWPTERSGLDDTPGNWGMLEIADGLVSVVMNQLHGVIDKRDIAQAYTVYGKIAAKRGQVAQAEEWFKKALAEHPKFEDAKLQIQLLSPPREFT